MNSGSVMRRTVWGNELSPTHRFHRHGVPCYSFASSEKSKLVDIDAWIVIESWGCTRFIIENPLVIYDTSSLRPLERVGRCSPMI